MSLKLKLVNYTEFVFVCENVSKSLTNSYQETFKMFFAFKSTCINRSFPSRPECYIYSCLLLIQKLFYYNLVALNRYFTRSFVGHHFHSAGHLISCTCCQQDSSTGAQGFSFKFINLCGW